MKKIYFLFAVIGLLPGNYKLNAQTIWTGTTVTFTKADSVDWTVEANQDRITDKVWITRADMKGIFNIVTETEYTKNSSPSDTKWAFGTTANIGTLTFQSWEEAIGSKPLEMLNKNMVVHLITDDIYINIKFTNWTSSNHGGGFSYQRSTANSTNNIDFEVNSNINLFPNPAVDFVQISGLTKTKNYEVYNILGKRVLEGTISDNQKINIQNFTNGLYFLKLGNENILKLIKD